MGWELRKRKRLDYYTPAAGRLEPLYMWSLNENRLSEHLQMRHTQSMCLSPFPGRKLIPNKDLPDKKDVILSECKEKGIFGSNTSSGGSNDFKVAPSHTF